ncbi:MAG: tripartite tricarboxylate transporter substrate binding protein [Burkholderiales bacterium]|nr:tripartite tricarboxylate transporter substrate binding protein [Burkholderiales bacterium]
MSAGVLAQPFPARPVRFIVPFTPGGSQDIIARLTGQKLAERLGQQFVVDNRAGAAGLIAAEATARAPADGHTILMATAGPITIAPHLHRKLAYDPARDFAPVIHLVDTPMALIASGALPAKTVAEVVALAKSRPGGLSAASTGNGSISHLTLELFKMRTGAAIVHVPYKGAAPAFTDLLGGQVQLLFTTTASAQPHVQSGKVRAVAVAAKRRSAMMPGTPTTAEAGLRDFEVPVWAGILTTAGTPRPVIEKLYREFHAALQEKAVQARLAQLGSDIAGDGPQSFAELIKADFARWAQVVRTANVRID